MSAIRPAGPQHAAHLVEGGERVGEQVQGGEAADRVEARVAERQRGRVAADQDQVAQLGRAAAPRRRARASSASASMPSDEPARADGARELAGEVAGPAGDVEHGVARAEPEQQPRDPHLLRHPRAGDALGHPPQRRAPVALVDRRHQPGDHQVLGRAGRLELALEQVEVAGVVDAPLRGEARRRARRAARAARSSAFAGAGLGGHRRRAGRPSGRASSVSRAIWRSPSTRAGSSARSGAIRRWIRLRI